MTALLRAEGLGKRYTIRPERSIVLGLLNRNKPRQHWALRGVDLDVHPGEVVAVIGRNGAGKSTLLKLAAGVTTPTTGSLVRPGRIAPLIEVGAGFHPDLSGRENVEVNARLLGIPAKEIRRSFDDIVGFAELEHAIDQPVRQYSTGMYMRLGFSVAVHTDPELLIVDEVLAVGDMPFQVRCLDRIRELREGGVGVLFVSHNLTAVQTLSDRAVLLENGEPRASGPVTEVLGAYHRILAEEPGGSRRADGAALELESVEVTSEDGAEVDLWQPGQRVLARLRVRALAPTPEASVGLGLTKDGTGMVATWVADDGPYCPALPGGGVAVIEARFALNVTEGAYLLDTAIAPRDRSGVLLYQTGIARFGVAHRVGGSGIADTSPSLDVRRVD